MKSENVRIDYGGARGSNTGDEFHELWVVRHALTMLDPCSELSAIQVEGVPFNNNKGNFWDGVDCTLLFSGDTLTDAKRVEIQQLKYSAAKATQKWTVARACAGKNGKPAGSLIHRLGQAFQALDAIRNGKDLDSIKITLVTNQPVSDELIEVLASARSNVPAVFKGAWETGGTKLHRLVHASGLSPGEFKRFAAVMDCRGSVGSRFAIEDAILGAIAEWKDVEFKEAATRLRGFVRNRMLPEAAGERITKQNVLIQFGVSDESAIFPCPPALKPVSHQVSREASKKVAEAMVRGTQRICFHGTAGVGKTTALQEVATLLPDGSQMIVFDCYGGGSYMDASRSRHRPRDAFVQLSNELAERLRLPALLVPSAALDYSKAFLRRLDIAARALERIYPKSLLVVAVDAADNSITAAEKQDWGETSFVTQLVSFGQLPLNVRVVVSARTGRVHELKAPSEFEHIELAPFTQDETAENVNRFWPAPAPWVEDFHHLSGGVPRVQDYAFERAGQDHDKALAALQPEGKVIDQVFAELFTTALEKSGRPDLIEKVCAGLVVLPRPIPVGDLAHVLQLSKSRVVDICADLAPGVRSHEDYLSFSDEDFEDYVRRRGVDAEQEVQAAAAEWCFSRADSDDYAARNVAHLLFVSGRHSELLDFVENEPEPRPAVIPDPVHRREIHDNRLLTGIRVCRQAGDTPRALRFVLIGAEAVRSSGSTRSLLASFPRLTVRYAKETAGRLILGNPDHVVEHGPLILQLLAEDARKGDRIAFRDDWRRLRAWGMAREDAYNSEWDEYGNTERWPIKSYDWASSVYGAAVLGGADAAIAEFSRFRAIRFAVSVGHAFVDRLLVEGRFELAEEIAKKCRSWQAVFLLVPLACAGRKIDLTHLERGLVALKGRFRLDAKLVEREYDDNRIGAYVLDTVLTAAEILVGRGVGAHLVSRILSPFVDPELRRIGQRFEFEIPLVDAILRSLCLSEAMSGNEVSPSMVFTERSKPKGEETKAKKHDASSSRHDDEMIELIEVIAPVYIQRAKSIVSAGHDDNDRINLDGLKSGFGGSEWRLNHRRRGVEYRATVSDRLTTLLALGANPREVYGYVTMLRGTIGNASRQFCQRFAPFPLLHSDIINDISKVASAMYVERCGAEDKSHRLSVLAELLIPFSPQDADAIFQKAVVVAGELDSEAMDQIRFLHDLLEHVKTSISRADRRSYASMLSEIVYDAGTRLQDLDEFPWRQAVSSIAKLDLSTGLGSAARWDDYSLEGIATTLPPVIAVGLRTKEFSSAQAASLLCMQDEPKPCLLKAIMERATDEGGSMASSVAEELARDATLGRVPCDDDLVSIITKHDSGGWTTQLLKQTEFRKALPSQEDENGNATQNHLAKSDIVNDYGWQDETLIDTKKLSGEAEGVLTRARFAGDHTSLRDVLTAASEAVPVRLYCNYLDALLGFLDENPDDQVLDVILESARGWIGHWAVERWCEDNLPQLIAKHLPRFTRYLPWEDNRLAPAMAMAQLSGSEAETVLLEGVERSSGEVDVRVIYILAGIIATKMTPDKAAGLYSWYLGRLFSRVACKDREAINPDDLPVKTNSAVARFLYAYLSEVDLRKRWRAAHALRRLARLGAEKTLAESIAQYSRTKECAFRAGNVPFYWLAARLWLLVALDRICGETPKAAWPHIQTILKVALSGEFPHVLVRSYAVDACRNLLNSGCTDLSSAQISELESVNKASIADSVATGIRSGSFVRHGNSGRVRRFDFDWLDTLRYWYEPWLRVFSGLRPEEFLDASERWIVDRWGVTEKSIPQGRDPRAWRFHDDSYGSWSNQQGGLPTLERFRSHLEWHAMWCVAGELSQSHLVWKEDYEATDELAIRISAEKLTCRSIWLSDLVGPPPLQKHRWKPIEEDSSKWPGGIEDEVFLREIFPEDRSDWVAVDVRTDSRYRGRREEIGIYSGLVSPATSHALVRALQTVSSQHEYYIPPEDHDAEIDKAEYKLKGWLKNVDGTHGFDRRDPFRHGVDRPQGLPGTAIVRALGLQRGPALQGLSWFREGANVPSVVYESWGDTDGEGRPYSNPGKGIVYGGRRTLVRKKDLAEFLRIEGRDLIFEVGVTRSDEKRAEQRYGAEGGKRAIFDRVLVLRQGGAVEAAERSFEAWR